MQKTIKARVRAVLPGRFCDLLPVAKEENMTQPVGKDENGQLWTERAEYALSASGVGATIRIVLKCPSEEDASPEE